MGLIAILMLFPALTLADGIIIPPVGVNMAVKYHHVTVDIRNQVATTKIDQVFINDSDVDSLEALYKNVIVSMAEQAYRVQETGTTYEPIFPTTFRLLQNYPNPFTPLDNFSRGHSSRSTILFHGVVGGHFKIDHGWAL